MNEPEPDTTTGSGRGETTTLGRRGALVVIAGSLAGCLQQLGSLEGGVDSPVIESDVDETVFVEARTADLPTPEEPPSIGVTNEGIFQYTESEGAWAPFDWTSVFGVTRDGQVSLGEREAPVESIATRTLNGVRQVRERAESGSGTKSDPFAVPDDVIEDYYGVVNFGRGWFEVDGLATDASHDYAERSTYLQGDGVRTTTLLHASDAPETPTVHLRGSGGNFGGVRDMTVYGPGEGDTSGSASVVKTDGNVIDYQFENVLFRWGGGDALEIEDSGSGARVQNAWLENVGGWALNHRGGERVKVDNVHTTGTVGGIRTEGTLGNFSNLTLTSLGGGSGVVSTSRGNQFSNVVVYGDANTGFEIRGANNTIENVYLSDLASAGFVIGSTATVSNVIAENFGDNHWEPMFDVHGDSCMIRNALARGGNDGRRLFELRSSANRCYLDGIAGEAGVEWNCMIREGATENVIDNLFGVPYDNIQDDGTRTLINRWGTNQGDPNESGEWNGHAEYAGALGATIWDTSSMSWTAYTATPDGEWR